MTKRFALMLMLILPLMAGCLTDSGGDDDDDDNGGSGGGANLTASEYVPLKTGSTYTYRETNYYGDVSEPDIDNFTTVVGSPVAMQGKTYMPMTDQYDGWDDSTYVRIANNIVYALETFYDITKPAIKADMPVARPADEYGTMVEVPMLNFSDGTWTVYTDSYSNEYGSTDLSWTGKYAGTETVTVPAGTFQNCAVFELTMDDDSTYQYSGISYTISSTTTLKVWCAKNVGWVKTHSVYSFDDGTSETHGNDVTTAELTAYNIP